MLTETVAYQLFEDELIYKNPTNPLTARNCKVVRGQNHCFLIVGKSQNGMITIMCSGSKKFKISISQNKTWRISATKGTSKAEAIIYLDAFRNQLNKTRAPNGGGVAKGFSIRKNQTPDSSRNFKTALACGYFHQAFIDFCVSHDRFCHFKFA